ncbi:MAG TPA: GGDEF domain-containing protein [Caulobacteraceae bacterium]|jgi:diguanylate cyclase|nr:GGDEF domain-containing protein [Caulobacteraceae bacterium]
MAVDLELVLRGPEAYPLARKALEEMDHRQVWPTPLNYEIWINCVGDPAGALAQEIDRLASQGEPITESVSEALAAQYLTKARLSDQIRDAGDQLSRELDTVSRAIDAAQKSSKAYGRTLAGASEKLAADPEPPALKKMVDTLTAATRRIEQENSSLERQLSDSTQEVSRLREHLEQVRRDAMTDGLTNLANRKAFDEALAKACVAADASGAPMTLAVVDIDHFKRFNDTWGHQTGDQVLRYVASVIGRLGDEPRVAARYGGEEFNLLFPGEAVGVVAGLLEEIRHEIAGRTLKRRSTNEDLGAVTISIGVAQRYPKESASSLIERADTALYSSKRSGRNRVTNAELTHAAA